MAEQRENYKGREIILRSGAEAQGRVPTREFQESRGELQMSPN